MLKRVSSLAHRDSGDPVYTFVDLFSGIGGMRIGFQAAGGRCVFSCDKDRWARLTYRSNFGDEPHPDIRMVDAKRDVPDHDVLVAGFPCQPFSLAGVSKKNSLDRPHGFFDETQGTLFFDVERIIRSKRPRVVVLENVRHLANHDQGRTLRIILDHLVAAGYATNWALLDARQYVPQSRVRLFLVATSTGEPFVFPASAAQSRPPKLRDILDSDVSPRYTLSDRLWAYLQGYAAKHRSLGNGFGYGLADLSGATRTLSARYHKDGSEILIPGGPGQNPRRLTPRECQRLMGFPDWFRIPDGVSDTQAYRQFGNSVVVPVVADIALAVREHLKGADESDAGRTGLAWQQPFAVVSD